MTIFNSGTFENQLATKYEISIFQAKIFHLENINAYDAFEFSGDLG